MSSMSSLPSSFVAFIVAQAAIEHIGHRHCTNHTTPLWWKRRRRSSKRKKEQKRNRTMSLSLPKLITTTKHFRWLCVLTHKFVSVIFQSAVPYKFTRIPWNEVHSTMRHTHTYSFIRSLAHTTLSTTHTLLGWFNLIRSRNRNKPRIKTAKIIKTTANETNSIQRKKCGRQKKLLFIMSMLRF